MAEGSKQNPDVISEVAVSQNEDGVEDYFSTLIASEVLENPIKTTSHANVDPIVPPPSENASSQDVDAGLEKEPENQEEMSSAPLEKSHAIGASHSTQILVSLKR